MTHKFCYIFILAVIIVFIGCVTLDEWLYSDDNESEEDILNSSKTGFSIKWKVDYKYPTPKDGYLIIKNPNTGREFKIDYKDFFVWKKSYENWRVVEKSDPMITDIEKKGNLLLVTFNYFDEESQSILSGQFIADRKYITNKSDQKKIRFWEGFSIGTGVYGVLVTILALLLIFL